MSKKVNWMVLLLVMLMAFGTSAFAGKDHVKKNGKKHVESSHHAKHGKSHGKSHKKSKKEIEVKTEGPAAGTNPDAQHTADTAVASS